jgi:glycosyltransferase involved in cell wall biosynthesis
MDNPKVSVLILTYNHEKFIAQTLESALDQSVDFPYEILVSDDYSTDATRQILTHYQQQHPDKIRLLLNEQNLGMHQNFCQAFFACTGQYIAMLEGDDYWTSSEKLQKQVNFLDRHPDFSLCFHDSWVVHEKGQWDDRQYCPEDLEAFPTLERLFAVNFIPTAAVMYRRGVVRELPKGLFTLKMMDWPLHLLHAQQGQMGYLNEIMSAYRIHAAGVWSSLSEAKRIKEIARMLEWINIFFDYKYEQIIDTCSLRFYDRYAQDLQAPMQQKIEFIQAQLQYHQNQSDYVQGKLEYTQGQLEYTQGQLEYTQGQLEYTQGQFQHGQNQLQHSQAEIVYYQVQLQHTQDELRHTQQQLQQSEIEVEVSRFRVERFRFKTGEKHQKLQKVRSRLVEAQAEIAAMQTSKFWQMRRAWFKLKRAIGLGNQE